MNELLKKIESKDVTEDNDYFYLQAVLVTKVFEKNKAKGEKKQSWWKRTMESQPDLGGLKALLEGKKMKKKH